MPDVIGITDRDIDTMCECARAGLFAGVVHACEGGDEPEHGDQIWESNIDFSDEGDNLGTVRIGYFLKGKHHGWEMARDSFKVKPGQKSPPPNPFNMPDALETAMNWMIEGLRSTLMRLQGLREYNGGSGSRTDDIVSALQQVTDDLRNTRDRMEAKGSKSKAHA